jgi:tight adherence protein B
MTLVAFTFVLVLAIVMGMYWVLVERPDARESAELRRRLGPTAQPAKFTHPLLKPEEKLSSVTQLDVALHRVGQVVAPLQRTIAQSGLKVTVGTVLLACGCCAGLTYIAVLRLLSLPLVAVVCGAFAFFLPIGYVRWKRTRRMLKFEEQFPEAIDLLARALRAGHALTTGLSMIAEELPEPTGPEFKLLYDQQNFGLPLPQALKLFAERIPSIDARFFVTAVLTQREAGGNLSEVLDNLAAIIRDRFKVKRQVRVISAHGRITGWVLSALPSSLAIFFALSNPAVYKKFYSDPLGAQLIGGALLLQLAGVLIIRKIVRIEY